MKSKLLLSSLFLILVGCDYKNYDYRTDFRRGPVNTYYSGSMKIWKMHDGTLCITNKDVNKFGIRLSFEDWDYLVEKVKYIEEDQDMPSYYGLLKENLKLKEEIKNLQDKK